MIPPRRALGLLAALLMVLPAVALADAVDHTGRSAGVEVVQQHSIFIEMFQVQRDRVNNRTHDYEERHPFAAVVGLYKECQIERRAFDDAVLWFNDQFLFGDKARVNRTLPVHDDLLGSNWNNQSKFKDRDGNVGRYTECGMDGDDLSAVFIPDLFMAAKPVDDPDILGNVVDRGNAQAGTEMDAVRDLITLDNDCEGCVFDYISTFFVTDPNNVQWAIDKYAYPVCVSFQDANGDGFPEPVTSPDQGGEDRDDVCGSRQTDVADDHGNDTEPSDNDHANACVGNGDDPNQPDTCRFETATDGNHVDQPGDGTATLKEPLWIGHLQVSPDRTGFRDEAPFRNSDGSYRWGAPRYDDGYCMNTPDLQDPACALEYDFVLVVDFAMADDGGFEDNAGEQWFGDEPEYDPSCKQHGNNTANANDSWLRGNSHPHDGNQNMSQLDRTPERDWAHEHDCLYLDIFPLEQAPYFTMVHPMLDEDLASPAPLNEDCSGLHSAFLYDDNGTPGDESDDAWVFPGVSGARRYGPDLDDHVAAREYEVCDVTRDLAEFHLHDGTQTPFGQVP